MLLEVAILVFDELRKAFSRAYPLQGAQQNRPRNNFSTQIFLPY
jgi:hypothetical protein